MMRASEIQIPEYERQQPAPYAAGRRTRGRDGGGDASGSDSGYDREGDVSSTLVEELRITEVFDFLDTKFAGPTPDSPPSHVGTLGLRQVRSAFTELGLEIPENLEDQFRRVDTDRDGRITLLELQLWLRKKGTNSDENTGEGEKKDVQKFFRVFADPRTNEITQTSFLRSARRFVPTYTDDLLVCMFQEFQNSDAVVTMEAFEDIGKETRFF